MERAIAYTLTLLFAVLVAAMIAVSAEAYHALDLAITTATQHLPASGE